MNGAVNAVSGFGKRNAYLVQVRPEIVKINVSLVWSISRRNVEMGNTYLTKISPYASPAALVVFPTLSTKVSHCSAGVFFNPLFTLNVDTGTETFPIKSSNDVAPS